MPVAKPPYAVPTLAQIRKRRRNGLVVVSTFSGCGGSCLGFRMAGFRVAFASEFVPAARDTYAANFPEVPIDDRDVRLLTGKEIRKLSGLGRAEIDVLEGSPPCASFSTSGNREEDWGKVKPYSDVSQRTDDLFFEFARLLSELQPRAFIAENVKGLVTGKAKGYYLRIRQALADAGYQVDARVLDAQWLGVPQHRERVILVGFRDDLADRVRFEWPKPLPYRYSVRDAIEGVVEYEFDNSGFHRHKGSADVPVPTTLAVGASVHHKVTVEAIEHSGGYGAMKRLRHDVGAPAPTMMAGGMAGNSSGHLKVVESVVVADGRVADYGRPRDDPVYDVTDEPAPAITTSPGTLAVERRYEDRDPSEPEGIAAYAIGREYNRLAPGEKSRRYQNLVRPDEAEPSPSVTAAGGGAGTASVAHPTERRKFTIAELRRLCAFPDDFVLTGSYRQQWERLGRAVPPPMMAAVARSLAAALKAL